MLTDGENEFRLAPAVAANVFLGAGAGRGARRDVMRLSDLEPDERAEVVALDEACQGFSRRRLMDLGFTAARTCGRCSRRLPATRARTKCAAPHGAAARTGRRRFWCGRERQAAA